MRVYLDVCEFFVFVCIYVCLSGDVCGRVNTLNCWRFVEWFVVVFVFLSSSSSSC